MLGKYLPFRDAQRRTSANKHRIYAKMNNGRASGVDRINASRFPQIVHRPKFQLDQNGKFFTIGSCFARNVEQRLAKMGVNLITKRGVLPRELYESGGIGADNGALNAYTPHSILDLIRLVERDDREQAGVLQVGDDQYVDMLMSGLRPLSSSELHRTRGALIHTYEGLSEADTVILTLGYTESWRDTHHNIFVNRSPAGNISLTRHGERYTFFNSDSDATIRVVNEAVNLIRIRTSGRAKVIITTSPVPLHGTFTEKDVICANLYSKSTLHSTAVQISDRYDWVDYFPSYEMVTYADRAWAWLDDGIHVNPEVVAEIMDNFAQIYFDRHIEAAAQ